MNRLLLIAILAALLWCGVELRRINHVRYRTAPAAPWPTTVHYYVPDGTCISVRNPDGGRE